MPWIWICPISSLAVYFSQEILRRIITVKHSAKVVKNLPVENLVEVGGNAADIGTHSTRKGAASYVLSQLGGPNIISVFLRCCWSLGNVQDRYIFLDAGGDQYLGRSVGGLPTSHHKFATLPPT